MSPPLDIVILGLSISSSWGNGHATTYRGLVKALARAGHRVLFLERDVPWYAEHRDAPCPEGCELRLYGSPSELRDEFTARVQDADAVIVGSYVPDGVGIADWVCATARGVTAFYDIDTPITLKNLRAGGAEYLLPSQVSTFDLYLSFAGGPALQELEKGFKARRAVPLYCSVDPEHYAPVRGTPSIDLGYLGTYSEDRMPAVERLLVAPARQEPPRRFVVAGSQYPEGIAWPANVHRLEHVTPPEHPRFYCASRFTLNVTRADMVAMGHSPSVRLFEAAACGVPIISDPWPGLESLFVPGVEILVARHGDEVLGYLALDAERAREIGEQARKKVLACHTSGHRAAELEGYLLAATARKVRKSRTAVRLSTS